MGVKATESGFNQTMRKDQATLIAELISRVTSLEEDMEFVLKHIRILEVDRQIDVISPNWDMRVKNYEMPSGAKATFEYDEYGVGKITLEAMDLMMGLIKPDIVRCGECKHFNLNEWDETISGVPIIVAHEICHKWGNGCKTDSNGFCFMGERRADDNTIKTNK